ncbi:MAG: hypothetical protein Q8K36_05185, partial [Alphaproteobacteria bacterium]|nr:hypothetical protein [Alphaproteobacteria bacterium]
MDGKPVPQSLMELFDVTKIKADANKKQIRQKTFLTALFYKTPRHFLDNCIGFSYDQEDIVERDRLRKLIEYRELRGPKKAEIAKKNRDFACLIEIDIAQDDVEKSDEEIQTLIDSSLANVDLGKDIKAILKRWSDAVMEENKICNELSIATAVNLSRLDSERRKPFYLLCVPVIGFVIFYSFNETIETISPTSTSNLSFNDFL